jgi:hypothetical protein
MCIISDVYRRLFCAMCGTSNPEDALSAVEAKLLLF